MGEVYRADDLKLGQPVALKFLPKALASDPVRRERFFAEVRITRQLAHPNICRVYDIAELDGQHFLSMEYIDGEDLASLIKRIGYLSNEKALDILRQLASGLSAAHEKGVLHRDLKPANIMIDGHGRVRITDFGLAIAASEEEGEVTEVLGTPAYMSPEQFAGKGATTRSDIYALGLVFYEVCTGKRAFSGTTITELRQQKAGQAPKAPSEIRQGMDPAVERLILRCIEREPRARPASVVQLAVALPGGDPLAAALAAGETPSPELVAASGSKEGLRPAIAVAILAWVIVGSILAIWLGERQMNRRNIEFGKPPLLLAESSKDFLRKSGYPEGSDSSYGYVISGGPLRVAIPGTDARDSAQALFWYRESPRPLTPVGLNSAGDSNDPPLQTPGEALVVLDTQGRLRFLRVVTTPNKEDTGSVPDWTNLFAQTNHKATDWTRVDPTRNPFFFADTQAAWQGVLSEQPELPLRIEAAMYQGRPVSFDVVDPSKQSRGPLAPPLSVVVPTGSLAIILIGGTALLARHNLRVGRGDRRSAARLAAGILVWILASWALRAHHSYFSPPAVLVRFLEVTAFALLLASMGWGFYIALEPWVRRRWPNVLVSWARLLSGEWRDALVGREVCLGLAFGVLVVVLVDRFPEPVGISQTGAQLNAAVGVGSFMATVLNNFGLSVLVSLAILCLFSILRILLRSDLALVLGVVLVPTFIELLRPDSGWIELAAVFVFQSILVLVLMRFGLVALSVMFQTEQTLVSFPLTLQTTAWYSPVSYSALAVIALIALYGFRTSLGGRAILSPLSTEQ
jgi:serine/threonine-protein kinase